jgi:hypothetical protein
MTKISFHPYKNEEECLHIGDDLTVENRVDRVSLYGSIDITRDKVGLENAKTLKSILEIILVELEKADDLPDRITVEQAETVKNPFT